MPPESVLDKNLVVIFNILILFLQKIERKTNDINCCNLMFARFDSFDFEGNFSI